MSLATRCIACGTVFRVVQDQLRVSSGWVRCGRCGEVFNAIESLVDLDIERPEGGLESVHRPRVMEELARVSGLGLTSAADQTPVGDESGHGIAPEPILEVPPPQVPCPQLAVPSGAEATQLPSPSPSDLTQSAAPEPLQTAALGPDRTPGFVAQADRAAKWRRPGVRLLLGAMALAGIAGLAWQVSLTHHDWLAARWPILRPAVERLCGWSGCSVASPRQLESLAVESSGLVRANGEEGYRLNVTLHNRAAIPVQVPALDLVLTDATGQIVARRVLRAAELGLGRADVEPNAELMLTGLLRIRGAPVTGYTIEIFYP